MHTKRQNTLTVLLKLQNKRPAQVKESEDKTQKNKEQSGGVDKSVGKLGDEEIKEIWGHWGSFHGETGSEKGGKKRLGPQKAEVK